MKANTQQPTRQDVSLLRSTLLKLTAAQKIFCAVIVALVAVVWYDLVNRLIAFGRDLDYGGLHALGVQTIALIKQYNPFFWWAVVALCTLIIAYFLYGFVQGMQRRARMKHVSEEIIAMLSRDLSDPALEVVRWAWHDRRNPISVGDLERAILELRSGRAAKISLARRHSVLIGAPVAPTSDR